MRILVAPDKFKDSLGAAEVADAIATGLREILPRAEIVLLPIADGGEGTAAVICAATGGKGHSCEVHDPLGEIGTAHYCTIAKGTTAVMEMSEASGLWRVAAERRDPIKASSFGTGEMLLDAARRGVKEIIIGLGGSATNDSGFGMARALGFSFLDQSGAKLIGPVSQLLNLARIETPSGLRLPEITAAVDVRNPLLGDRGATRVFATQKGATPPQLELLERALTRLAEVVTRDLGMDYGGFAGAGAAGGLGFGLMSFCSAKTRSGFEVVAERIGLAAAVRDADVVITGEGRLDRQTLEGKAPAGVAQLARTAGKQVFAIVGHCETQSDFLRLFDRIFVLRETRPAEAADVSGSSELLRERARELAHSLA